MAKQHIHKRKYYLVILIAGLVSGFISSRFLSTELAVLIGWDSAAVLLLLGLLRAMRGRGATTTAQIARHQYLDHTIVDTLLLATALFSLVAVAALLRAGHNTGDITHIARIAFGIFSTVVSWATIQTLYTLRYAALYYRGHEGGVDFGADKPTFSDFAYLAFTIGMTYQVSDTTLTNHEFRSTVWRHALVSFLFGVAIIASAINLVVTLLV